jgi:hypothetical protein
MSGSRAYSLAATRVLVLRDHVGLLSLKPATPRRRPYLVKFADLALGVVPPGPVARTTA